MRWPTFIVFVCVTSLPIVGLLKMATKEEPTPNFKGGLNRGTPIPPPKPRVISHHRARVLIRRWTQYLVN